MDSSAYAFTYGVRRTRGTPRAWQQGRWRILRRWAAAPRSRRLGCWQRCWSLRALQRRLRTIPPEPPFAVGNLADVAGILGHNLLALALHAMACVAGFIAGSSLPLQADSHHGFSRWVHQHGGRIAIAFVVCATTFSLSAQAYLLGDRLAAFSHAARRARGAAAARRSAPRRARADGAVPPARRMDHGQPPRRVGPAARGDPRDGCRRDTRARCGGACRGLHLPHLFHALVGARLPVVAALQRMNDVTARALCTPHRAARTPGCRRALHLSAARFAGFLQEHPVNAPARHGRRACHEQEHVALPHRQDRPKSGYGHVAAKAPATRRRRDLSRRLLPPRTARAPRAIHRTSVRRPLHCNHVSTTAICIPGRPQPIGQARRAHPQRRVV